MNGMIAWWARNGVAANLLMLGILLAGVLGFLRLDREVFPTVRPNEVQVIVAWPGAAPQEVEEQVVMRIEEVLTDVEGIAHIGAVAQEGLATVSVEAGSRIDMGEFIDEIKRRVDTINSFPVDIERPVVAQLQQRDEAIRLALHGEIGERELKRIAEDLRDQVARLPGVSLVSLFGVRKEEVSVELSTEAMRRYGLSFDEVARAIRGSSLNASAGTVRTEGGDIQLRARNLAGSEEEFAQLVVRESASGGIVRLGDVAQVVDGFEDNELLATLNGTPAVLLQVMNTEHMDVVQMSDSILDWLPRARATLPAGVELTLWWDAAEMYRSRMHTLGSSALSGLVLVFVVLMLTLRPRVALWVTAGIATSYAGACALLPVFDVSINIMSTFAFMLVLGVMVDDAIVIGESIHEECGPPGGGLRAAVHGTQSVAKPVLFGVLTMAVAFMPWFFISGQEAQITRQISIVIVLSLLFSLIDAFLVLPAHLAHLGPRRDRSRLARMQHRVELALTAFAHGSYRRHLGRVVRRHYLTVSVFLALFLVGIGAVSGGWLRFSFMPDIEGDQIVVNIELPEGAPYSRALEILAQLQRAERELVEEVNALGEGKLVESWYTRSRRDSVIAIVKLVPPEVRALSAKVAAERLRELVGDIPDAEAISVQHSMNYREADLQYQVSHTDPEELKRAVQALQEQLGRYDTVYDLRDNLRDTTEELRFRLLPGAERMGITLAEVTRQVRQAYFGQEVQRLPRDGGDVKVMVRFPRESRSNLHSLAALRLSTADGREVPLLAVAEVEYHPGVQKIERKERQRAVVVSAELRDEVRHRIQHDLDTEFLPRWRAEFPGASIRAVGEAEGESEFLQEVASLYAIALFLMYALIAVAFRSYWQPLIIMTAIPFGYLGAVLGHLAYDMPMTLFSYFGIGAASGVVINDNLVLMDRIATLRERGLSAVDAVLQAGVTRFRPILLTSITTFIGLLPAMTDASIEAQFLQPTTVALAWGVATATFVTLLLTPALYLVGEDIRAALGRMLRRGGATEETAPATSA